MERKPIESAMVMEGLAESTYKVITHPGNAIPEAYKGLVYARWLRSLRKGNDYFKLIASDAYYKSYQQYIALLLDRPSSIVRIAVLSDVPDVALGFCVFEDSTLHYAYTVTCSRRQGIAKALVPPDIQTITHVTKTGLIIWNDKLPNAVFNPFY